MLNEVTTCDIPGCDHQLLKPVLALFWFHGAFTVWVSLTSLIRPCFQWQQTAIFSKNKQCAICLAPNVEQRKFGTSRRKDEEGTVRTT